MPVHGRQVLFWILTDISAIYTGLGDMRSMDNPCAFKEVSVDQEEYPKAAQMALEIYVWSTGSNPRSLCFALT